MRNYYSIIWKIVRKATNTITRLSVTWGYRVISEVTKLEWLTRRKRAPANSTSNIKLLPRMMSICGQKRLANSLRNCQRIFTLYRVCRQTVKSNLEETRYPCVFMNKELCYVKYCTYREYSQWHIMAKTKPTHQQRLALLPLLLPKATHTHSATYTSYPNEAVTTGQTDCI